jgi:hypothetical protein
MILFYLFFLFLFLFLFYYYEPSHCSHKSRFVLIDPVGDQITLLDILSLLNSLLAVIIDVSRVIPSSPNLQQ